MRGLLHCSEKFEFHETENQTVRHGLACANRVAKSNALVGLHFEGPFAACRRSASPNPLPGNVAIDRPGRVDCRLGEPNRKPAPDQVQSIEMSNSSGEIKESRNCILFGNKARKGRVS
jgi:hypothetical protein